MKLIEKSKLEILIWAGIFVIFAILFILNSTAKKGMAVQVRVDGDVFATYSLGKDGKYPIIKNGKNILIISDGKAYINEADCPDKLCVKQGKISRVGRNLICLPNKVVIEVLSEDDETKVDAVVH